MRSRARTIEHAAETWVNLEDLRCAFRDDEELVLKMGAMLKVSLAKGDSGTRALRLAVAYALTELVGTFAHEDN